ncbi:SRPBCC domain-containing protein [Dyadobacter sp. LHD-138]|uniref:SRPBCC family protein n=1 Tax=Dyadobacter sp. LHD-138 TaxID=3071413 RepID=UPI0027E19286|nr:SRPBCC domain-containing protein [Dyadobacter sp. LHD-138]MDQ6479848.1 SRPBCC domain-containing protein [Dyadobacter sp. LHD-138]
METKNTEPFVVESTYRAPVGKVWQAITDNAKMRQWYFDIAEFKPEVGCEFEFYGENEGVKYRHLCIVTAVEKEKKLAYSWRYDGYPGNSLVTFTLFPEGDKTRIKLTHEGLETFPDLKDFKRENFAAGWNEIIGTMLKEYVE